MAPDRARRLLAVIGLLALAPHHAHAQDFHAVPPAVLHAVSGGFWQTGNSRGHVRLLVIGGEPDRGGPRLVIQWIEELPNARTVVRQTQPIHAITAPWELEPPTLLAATTGLKASITGTNPHTHCTATWTVTAGTPGQYSVQPDR